MLSCADAHLAAIDHRQPLLKDIRRLFLPHHEGLMRPGRDLAPKLVPQALPALRAPRLCWALLLLRLAVCWLHWPRRALRGACPTLTLQQHSVQPVSHYPSVNMVGKGTIHSVILSCLPPRKEGSCLKNISLSWGWAWQLPCSNLRGDRVCSQM